MLFEEDKTKNEQRLGALEQAIKVMTGAGAGKKGFLETMQEAQLLSIVGGVRDVVSKPTVMDKMSDTDIWSSLPLGGLGIGLPLTKQISCVFPRCHDCYLPRCSFVVHDCVSYVAV